MHARARNLPTAWVRCYLAREIVAEVPALMDALARNV